MTGVTWAQSAPQDTATQGTAEQGQAQELKTIVVTGSRIRQVDLETAQPLFTMNREAIEKTGLATVGDIISHMTIQGSPTFNKQSVLASNAEQGGSYVDMRNLGANRVLVLVNGKRWVTTSSGMVDLSTIPSSVIERIDVLKDGASAVYGSDAVSGVINIITRKNFTGAEAHVYYGENGKGDGQTQQYSFTMGQSSDKGSLMMGVSYNKQDVIWNKSRELTRYSYGPRHPDVGLSAYGPVSKFEDMTTGDTWALNGAGLDATDFNNYHLYQGAASDAYNPSLQMMYRLPTEQKSIYVEGTYNFTNNLSFHSTAMYSERVSNVQIAGYPNRSAGWASEALGLDGLISPDSIYNPLPGHSLGFFRRTTEMPRTTRNTNQAKHLDASLQGYFSIGTHFWNWDAGVNYNQGSGVMVGQGNLNIIHANNSIGASFIDADGVARCGTAGNVIEGCIPWNVLGGPSAMTPELRNYLFVQSQRTYGSKDISYEANITGGLWDIPTGGELAFAAGAQRREVSGYDNPDALAQAGLTTSLASAPTSGQYAVNSVYAELRIPVLIGMTGAQLLSFDIASRYSKYSNFGSTTNNKYSFEWKPIEDLLVRGNYAESYRAPTIDNLFGGASETFDNYTDPCDVNFGANTYGQDVYNACVSSLAGLGINPGSFHQTDATGNPVTAPNAQSTTPFKSGSNANLMPETATTKTVGLVYSPHFVPGLSVTVDWYEIKISNIISGITSDDVLKFCYQGDAAYCSQFSRDATGQVVGLNHSLTNMGTQDVEGYDVELAYTLPETAIGRFRVRSNSSYLTKWNSQASSDVPVSTGASWYSIWRLRNNTSLDWDWGNFGATWTVRYFSGLKEACYFAEECNMPNFSAPDSGPSPTRRVGAVAFNDVSFRWKAPWNAKVSIGVNNVFNRTPPIMYAGTDNGGSPPYNPAYDIDRYWFVSYDQTF